MPKKSPIGLKLAGPLSNDNEDVPTPFTVSVAVLPHPGPSKCGFSERISAHWVGEEA